MFARYPGKGTVISLDIFLGEDMTSETVQWALNATTATIQNVGVDHCRPHVLVAKQLLHRADVVSSGQQVSRERMAKCARTDALGDSRGDDGSMDRIAHC